MSFALQYVQGVPWMITSDYLELIISVCARERSPEEIAAAIELATRQREAYDASPVMIAAQRGEPLAKGSRIRMREGVAILPVMGTIIRHASFFKEVSGAV